MTREDEKDPIVEKKIGERFMQIRASHKLPTYYTGSASYDRALPRISEEINQIDGYLTMIDIGANIGDTVFLVTDRISGTFLCVEGDEDFLPLLRTNTSRVTDSKIVIEGSYCGEESRKNKKLEVHREHGTARIVPGLKTDTHNGVRIKSLDRMIDEHVSFDKANLLKIDTDGFDFSVLKSGKNFLKETKPVIYFEFDPELYSVTDTEPLDVFDYLHKNGYHDALFYDNYGIPVKIIDLSDQKELKRLIGDIDKKTVYYYDVLTFHHSKSVKYRPLFENELFSSISIFSKFADSVKDQSAILDSTKAALESSRKNFTMAEADLNDTRSHLDLISKKLIYTEAQLETKSYELNSIYRSRAWRMALCFRKIWVFFIPGERMRDRIKSGLSSLIHLLIKRKTNENQ